MQFIMNLRFIIIFFYAHNFTQSAVETGISKLNSREGYLFLMEKSKLSII